MTGETLCLGATCRIVIASNRWLLGAFSGDLRPRSPCASRGISNALLASATPCDVLSGTSKPRVGGSIPSGHASDHDKHSRVPIDVEASSARMGCVARRTSGDPLKHRLRQRRLRTGARQAAFAVKLPALACSCAPGIPRLRGRVPRPVSALHGDFGPVAPLAERSMTQERAVVFVGVASVV